MENVNSARCLDALYLGVPTQHRHLGYAYNFLVLKSVVYKNNMVHLEKSDNGKRENKQLDNIY